MQSGLSGVSLWWGHDVRWVVVVAFDLPGVGSLAVSVVFSLRSRALFLDGRALGPTGEFGPPSQQP